MTRLDVQCCIAGGGPAGMMLGLLLARAGIRVVVLEKHADFLRDFRGDTIHPSTLELMHELGVLDRFLALPHTEVRTLSGRIADQPVVLADFSQLPTVCKFIALMPQWDFLDFLADEARAYPTFELRMSTEVVDLVHDDADNPDDAQRAESRVAGVRARSAEGELEVRAALTVAADGRHSLLREKAGLVVNSFGAPIDVLWMRLSKRPDDSVETLGYINAGHVFVTLDRGEYWQCAFVIPKGGYDALRRKGLEALRASIITTVPFMKERVGELTDWEQIRLLTVLVDRLESWSRDGLLCIGDAAHAMSPIGGVGINLAIQDAVATANLLKGPLLAGTPTAQDLSRVQQRRERPTALTQRVQMMIQDRVINRTLTSGTASMPLFVRLAQRFPILQRIPARIVGMGFGPEHIH